MFLDEIGEVETAIQVKLLRVLQTRTFQRLGDTADRAFSGKLIAATNRDLRQALAAGRFREDFYYRLCADLLVTPSLAERLRDTPGELRTLLRAIARRVAGDEEADDVAAEAEAWIGEHLGPDYAWPGNVRELEQCVRNLVIRGTYEPQGPASVGARATFLEAIADRGAQRRRAPAPLLHVGLRADGELQRDGPAARPRSPHGAGPRRSRVAGRAPGIHRGARGRGELAAASAARLGRASTGHGVTDGWPR